MVATDDLFDLYIGSEKKSAGGTWAWLYINMVQCWNTTLMEAYNNIYGYPPFFSSQVYLVFAHFWF